MKYISHAIVLLLLAACTGTLSATDLKPIELKPLDAKPTEGETQDGKSKKERPAITHSFLATGGKTYIVEYIEPKKDESNDKYRPDVVFDDFEKPNYAGWISSGSAFGNAPIVKAKMPAYQGDVKSQGKQLVNSHNTRNGEEVQAGDAHTGTLTSKSFKIKHKYIRFLVGGGAHTGKTCINLMIDGKVARSATGRNSNAMAVEQFDVKEFAGKQAYFRIVDEVEGGWGNISVDNIVMTDKALTDSDAKQAGYEVTWIYPLPTRDGWVLPDGHILLAIGKCTEYPNGGAVEIDRTGKKYWEYKGTQSEVDTIEKTAEGNYLLTVAGDHPTLYEFAPSGRRVMMIALSTQKKNHHMQQRMSRKLPNGNYLVPHLLDKKIVEYQPHKGIVSTIHTPNWPFTAIRLENGNTLTTCTYGHTAIEYDKDGKIHWQVSGEDLEGTELTDVCGAQRLPNGNTILCDYGAGRSNGPKLIEVTPDKKVVWTYNNEFRAGIHHVHIFKTNGVPLKGKPMR